MQGPNLKLTVEQVLTTTGLRKGKVLAGRGGLQRQLTRITVAETPDSLDWLEGGELVCTTGYAMINDPKLQRDWVHGMAEKKVAALIIKPERFFGSLPDHMAEIADEVDFPLIELPLEVLWPTVIEGIMNLMLSLQVEQVRASYDIYNRLTQLVLSSEGVQSIIEAISRLAKNPVVLEDRFLNAISHSESPNPIHREHAQLRRQPPQRDQVKRLIKALGETRANSILTLSMEAASGGIEQLIAPIVAGRHLFGYLSLLIVDDDSPGREMSQTIIKHGATALALELLNDNTRFQMNTMEKTGLLKLLTGDTLLPLSELRKKGGLFGIDFDLDTAVIAISTEPKVTSYSFSRLEKKLLAEDPNAVVFFDQGKIIAFFHPAEAAGQRQAMKKTAAVTRTLLAGLEKEQYQCRAGVGNAYRHPEPMRRSYFEAMGGLSRARAQKLRLVCHDYRSFDSLVSMLPNPNDLLGLANNALYDLIEYDRANNTELLKTLRNYISHKYNQAQTAKFTNIHINTLSYRLTRIQEILDVDLNDTETCTMLFFCLKVLEERQPD